MENWEKVRLGDVCEVSAGQGAPQGTSNYSETGTPFVKAGNLLDLISGKSENDIQKVTEEVAKAYKLKKYPANSILFAKSGMSCMKGYVYKLKNDAFVVNHLAICIPKKVDANYLNFCLRYLKPNTLVKDPSYPSISLEDISNFQIPLPPLETQKHIACVLDKASSIIEKNKTLLAKYDLLIKSVFVQMFGDPIENPKGWEVKKLGETAEIITGNTPSRKEKDNYGSYIEWIKTDNITNEIYVTKARENLSEKGEKLGRTVESGSILMACIAGSLKSIGRVALTNRKVAFNQQINAIVPKSYNNLFLYVLFQNTQNYAQSTVNMSLKGILSKGKLEELEYITPPLSLQNDFASFVEKVEQSKQKASLSLQKAQTLYKSLMQQYFG